jgi:GDP-L-fucose synthase
LKQKGCLKVFAPTRKEFDLRVASEILRLLSESRPDLIIHLAAICGGIEANRQRPGTFFYDNAMMGIQLIEQARLARVSKTLVLGTVCAYPKFTPVPFKESDFWLGFPEETNAPYGLAKKMLLVQLQAYRQQYGFHGIYLLPVNLYGPGDSFDLTTSHVIPAMIRKMIEAKRQGADKVVLWGSGDVSREFLFVDDCVEAILLAAEKYDGSEPVNVGSGRSVWIRDLALLIQKIVGYSGVIEWDRTRPDGQPKRQLDVTRAQSEFGFQAKTSLEEGLRKTVEWYESYA